MNEVTTFLDAVLGFVKLCLGLSKARTFVGKAFTNGDVLVKVLASGKVLWVLVPSAGTAYAYDMLDKGRLSAKDLNECRTERAEDWLFEHAYDQGEAEMWLAAKEESEMLDFVKHHAISEQQTEMADLMYRNGL